MLGGAKMWLWHSVSFKNKQNDLIKVQKNHIIYFGAETCSSWHLIGSAFCNLIYCILIGLFYWFGLCYD